MSIRESCFISVIHIVCWGGAGRGVVLTSSWVVLKDMIDLVLFRFEGQSGTIFLDFWWDPLL